MLDVILISPMRYTCPAHVIPFNLSTLIISGEEYKLKSWCCLCVQWYSAGLRAGWSGFRALTGAMNFSLRHRVQTCSGAHQASYPMGTGASFSGGKATEAWSWGLNFI
jgi:hypothetical protein